MRYKIDYKQTALDDIISVTDYLGERSVTGMYSIMKDIREKIDFLSTSPRIGTVVEKRPKFRRTMAWNGGYKIYYQVDEKAKTVWIVRVLHSSRFDAYI